MNMTIKEVERLTKIINKTRKMRVKLKLSKRISEGALDYFMEWVRDNKVPYGARMPDSIELINRYGK